MGYSELGIVNMALSRIGVKKITQSDWDDGGTQQSIDAKAVWQYIRDEVLETKDWRFAKTSIYLDKSDISPSNGYAYAYPLPNDFLRFIKKTDFDSPLFPTSGPGPIGYDYLVETLQLPEGLEKITNGGFTGAATGWVLGTGWVYDTNNVAKVAGAINTLSQLYDGMVSPPVVDESYLLEFEITAIGDGSLIPSVGGGVGNPVSSIGTWDQIITAISATSGVVFTPSDPDLTCTIGNISLFKISDRRCLFIDYYNTTDPLGITYIKRTVDCTKYPPSFINVLAFRLAAELAIPRTEGKEKFGAMMQLYEGALIKAEGVNQSSDYLECESGSDSWERAGR